jgi:hypothetical protein
LPGGEVERFKRRAAKMNGGDPHAGVEHEDHAVIFRCL